nr:MAG TPA: zinc-ribbon domain protein [Caudoviricetes sp.]
MDFACCHCKKISKKSSNLISTGVQNSLYRFVNATWYGIDVKGVAAILLITHLIIPFFGRFYGQTYSDY